MGEVRTLVLVGRTGNGKSATGNSIIGSREFESMASIGGVTSACDIKQTVLKDGRIINVIDTPGLCDSTHEHEFIRDQIVDCIKMAKDGIHAVLVVLSIRNRFTREEKDAVVSLMELFGNQISKYMVVVFTGGDDLNTNQTLEDYLCRNCPLPLKEILEMCGNRCVLFDNKTTDDMKKSKQLDELFLVVDEVVTNNGGKPYTNELLLELKMRTYELHEKTAEMLKSEYSEKQVPDFQEQLNRLADMVDSKLSLTGLKLEAQLEEERAARSRLEMFAQAAQSKSDEVIQQLQKESEELRKKIENKKEQSARAKAEKKAQADKLKADKETEQPRDSLKKAHREVNETHEEIDGSVALEVGPPAKPVPDAPRRSQRGWIPNRKYFPES